MAARPAVAVLAGAVALLAAAWLGAVRAQGPFESRDDADPEAGRKAATKVCARCHVIGEHNRMGGINSTPSFYIMQENPDRYHGKLLTVTQRRPHIGMGLEMEPEALDNIWAYVETLRRP